jgi:uncharacterized membrane protein YjfL (UPF0719 family)
VDSKLLTDFARAVLWSFVAAIAMGISMGMVIKIYDFLTPGLEELDELRKGNVAVGIVLGSVILATGYVIGMVFHTPGGQ